MIAENSSSLPQNSKEALDQFKGTLDVLNEYREPTKSISTSSSFIISSPIILYLIYSIIIIIITVSFLYWRYKNQN